MTVNKVYSLVNMSDDSDETDLLEIRQAENVMLISMGVMIIIPSILAPWKLLSLGQLMACSYGLMLVFCITCQRLYNVVWKSKGHDAVKYHNVWIMVAFIEVFLCIANVRFHQSIYTYCLFTSLFLTIIYVNIGRSSPEVMLYLHSINNILKFLYFTFKYKNTFLSWWFLGKVVLNVICIIFDSFGIYPIRLFHRYRSKYDKTRVPKLVSIGNLGATYPLRSLSIGVRKYPPIEPEVHTIEPHDPLCVGKLREAIRDDKLGNSMHNFSRSDREYIMFNVDFNMLRTLNSYTFTKLMVLWKEGIYKNRALIKGFDIKEFFRVNTNIGLPGEDVVKLINEYNPTTITDWKQLINSYYDPLKIMENMPKDILLFLITRRLGHTKYFDEFTNVVNIPIDILSELPYKLLKRVNRWNKYSILERMAFSDTIPGLPVRFSTYLNRNISRSSKIFFRLSYKNLYPIHIPWECTDPVKISPFVNLTSHDWATIKLTERSLGDEKTKLLDKRIPYWMIF